VDRITDSPNLEAIEGINDFYEAISYASVIKLEKGLSRTIPAIEGF